MPYKNAEAVKGSIELLRLRRNSYLNALTGTTDYRDRIVLDPKIRFGKPVVRGTRISVGDVLGYLAAGMSEAEILADFPQLTHDDVLACLGFAVDPERRLVSLSGV